MKLTSKHNTKILLFFVFVLACREPVPETVSFPLEATINTHEFKKGEKDIPREMTFSIKPSYPVTNQAKFYFSFEQEQGRGIYIFNGDTLQPQQNVELKKLNNNRITYIPKTIGKQVIKLTFGDKNKNNKRRYILTQEVVYSAFSQKITIPNSIFNGASAPCELGNFQ